MAGWEGSHEFLIRSEELGLVRNDNDSAEAEMLKSQQKLRPKFRRRQILFNFLRDCYRCGGGIEMHPGPFHLTNISHSLSASSYTMSIDELSRQRKYGTEHLPQIAKHGHGLP